MYRLREYYGDGRFADINQKIDSFLRSILGNFRWEGPRNWFGSTYEGAWSRINPKFIMGDIWMPIGFITLFILLLLSVNYINIGNTEIATKYIVLSTLLIFTGIVLGLNIFNVISVGEYVYGQHQNYKEPLKIAVILLLLSLIISFLFFGFKYQSVTNFGTGIIAILTVIFLSPNVEVYFFNGFMAPTMARYFGIIPGAIITMFFQTGFHYVLFGPIALLFSSIFSLINTIPTLAYQSDEIPLYTHILFNTVLFLLQT